MCRRNRRQCCGTLGVHYAWAVSKEDPSAGLHRYTELLAGDCVVSSGGRAMYCNYCGKVIQDDAAVCAYCGIRVGASLARKRLVRPRQGRKVAGVCLGCAEYFDIDVTAIRLVWLIASF